MVNENRTQIEPDASGDVTPAAGEGDSNAAPITTNKAADQAEPTEGGEGAGESGEEAGADGAAGGELEAEEGAEGVAAPAYAEQIEKLNKRLDDLQSGKVGNDEAEPDLAKDVLMPEFTEPFLAKMQDEYEVTPKQANLMRGMINEVAQRILKQVQGTTAGYRKDQNITAMASERDSAGKVKFPGMNTPQMRAGMDEFLKDYSPGIHARKDLLERSFWYARGKMSTADMAKLRKGKEVSRTIAGKTKMAPAAGGAGGEKAVVLTNAQRIASKYHPGGEKGYIADMKRGGGVRRARIEAAA